MVALAVSACDEVSSPELASTADGGSAVNEAPQSERDAASDVVARMDHSRAPDASAPVALSSKLCADTIDRGSPVLSNGFSFDLSNTRHHPSQIDSSNVATLEVAYVHTAEGATGKRGAPAVTEQAIFFSAGRDIVAMNRQSGCVYWKYSVKEASAGLLLGNSVIRSSAVYLIDDDPKQPALIVVGDSLGIVYAVDAETGKEVWKKFLGTIPQHHWVTGSFQYYDGKLFVPYASKEVIQASLSFGDCCSSHGLLQAVDAYSGEIAWTYHTTPEATAQPGSIPRGPSGAGAWGVPAIDPKRNTLYFGTGQNYTRPVTETSDAIIALDMSDGSVRWMFQATPDDAWNASCELPTPIDLSCAQPKGHDFDFAAPPVLVHQADRRDVVLAADKAGGLYSLDADDGSLIWSYKVGKGSALGGVHWGIAVDEQNVYVAVADTFADKTTALNLGAIGGLLNGITPPISPVEGGTPGIYAFEIQTGRKLWYVQPTHDYEGKSYISVYSAAVSVTNDVVFAGALDGEVRAFSTRDGSQLWSFDTDVPFMGINGVAGDGGTIDSVGAIPFADTLLVNSGYDNFGGIDAYQAGPGNGLYVFRLPSP